MFIREYMQTKVVSISSMALVPDAEKIMQNHDIRRLPVIDHGRLKGLVTEKELIRLKPSSVSYVSHWETKYVIGNMLVKDVMVKAKDLIIVNPDTTVEEAVFLGQQHQVGVLPVVDQKDRDKLVGIVTMTDLFKITMQALGFGKKGVRLHIFNCREAWHQRDAINVILSHKVNIHSLFHITVPATARQDLIISLDTIDAVDIIDELRAKGFTVETR